MEFQHEQVNDVTVLRVLDTRITSVSAPELKTELLRLVGEGQFKIVVNLENIAYIDSSGLGSLLFGHRQARQAEGDLKLSHVQDSVLSMIKLSMLERVLNIYATDQDAIADFGS